jgi:AraC family transcriptional regulator
MKPATRSVYALAAQRVIEHVHAHLDEALDLETLASGACLSPFHFHRVFRGMVGETPVELIRRLRMERAAWQLIHTDRPVTAIAFDAGYETHEAFTRSFRAQYDASPSGFRRRKNPRIGLAASCGVHFDPGGLVPPFIPRDSGGERMQVEIRDVPELRVGGVPHRGPYNQIGEAFGRLGRIAGSAGLFQQPGAAMVGIYHDDPDSTPADQLRSDAAIVVPDGVKLPAELAEQRLPSGRYAVALHQGSYEQLPDAWMRLMGEWLPASGQRVAESASYEYYLNDPTNTPKEQLKTEIRIPLV